MNIDEFLYVTGIVDHIKAFLWLLYGSMTATGGINGRSHIDPDPRRFRFRPTAWLRTGQARFKLIETGTRNRLIHTPRGGKRSRALHITGNVSDQVFANLLRENKPLHFLAAQKIADIQREAARLKAPRLVTTKTSYRNGLQTSFSPEFLHKRLHAIHSDAKTAEEERGRLHAQIGDTALTPYQALSIQIAAAARGSTPDARLVEEGAHWTGKEFAEKVRLTERLADLRCRRSGRQMAAAPGALSPHVPSGGLDGAGRKASRAPC